MIKPHFVNTHCFINFRTSAVALLEEAAGMIQLGGRVNRIGLFLIPAAKHGQMDVGREIIHQISTMR